MVDTRKVDAFACAHHPRRPMSRLSHLDARGLVCMVDVSSKAETAREAVARGRVRVAPATLRMVRQGKTPKGNLLATAAGLSVLRRLTRAVYERLEDNGRRLDALGDYGRFERVGAMATLFVDDYPRLFRHLLERGIYLAPSQNEAMFLSTVHGDEEIDRTVQAVAEFAESK